MKKFLALSVLVLALSMAFAACSSSEDDPESPPGSVTSVTIVGAEAAVNLIPSPYKALVLPTDATNKTVTWSVTPTTGAIITSGGVFSAQATGTYTITATAGGVSDKKVVVVVSTLSQIVNVSGVTITGSSSAIVDTPQTYTATVLPDNATNKVVTWSVVPSTAAITDGGVFTATTSGAYVITAAAGNKSASKTVVVTSSSTSPGEPTTSVTITGVGTTKILVPTPYTAVVLPINAPDRTVIWSVTPVTSAVITVDGVFQAIEAGTYTIMATTVDGASATKKVVVTE